MKNTLGDLNNHLFAELERLSDEDLKGDELKQEITRAKAVTDVASRIVENASLVLDAEKFRIDILGENKETTSKLLEG